MNKFVILALVALAQAGTTVTAERTVSADELPTALDISLSVMNKQSVFWIGFLLPILAIYFAYMLHADNEPDT